MQSEIIEKSYQVIKYILTLTEQTKLTKNQDVTIH